MPLFTGSPATEHEGASTVVKMVCCAAGLRLLLGGGDLLLLGLDRVDLGRIPLGVMSGVPTMNSFFRFLFTVCPPHAPSAIATMPKTMSTAPATNPPIFNAFFIRPPLSVSGLLAAAV